MTVTGQARRGRPRTFDRDRALRRALDLFWQYGYEGVAISDLTTELGIGSTSLYAAFGSKRALFDECLALYDVESAPIVRGLVAPISTRAAVEMLLRDSASAYTSDESTAGCLLDFAASCCAPENDDVRRAVEKLRKADRTAVRARLQRGVDEGDLVSCVEVDALASYLMTVLRGMSVEARDGATRMQLERTVDLALAAWDALAAPDGQVSD
ncbi:MAG: TetR/AcrR family transcriptional regulator [Homoserinimonas sp.]